LWAGQGIAAASVRERGTPFIIERDLIIAPIIELRRPRALVRGVIYSAPRSVPLDHLKSELIASLEAGSYVHCGVSAITACHFQFYAFVAMHNRGFGFIIICPLVSVKIRQIFTGRSHARANFIRTKAEYLLKFENNRQIFLYALTCIISTRTNTYSETVIASNANPFNNKFFLIPVFNKTLRRNHAVI
jgi:hypothetical protein